MSTVIVAASIAAGHPFKHEESARQWLEQLPTQEREQHMARARAKVYMQSARKHVALLSEAMWRKAGLA